MSEKSIEWKDFELSVDLHKSYIDFVVKLNLFYYAITGALLSFHFAKESPSVSVLGLLLPIAFSLSLGGLFVYGGKLAGNLRANIKARADQLGLQVYPEGIILVLLCYIFGTIMFGVGVALIGYLCSKSL